MNIFLRLAFLFFMGSVSGWVLELFFRRYVAHGNTEKKWINPGFCTGPYLPIYGFGLCLMYLTASLEKFSFTENALLEKILILAVMAIFMTVIEYIAGILSLKLLKVRLWDYSDNRGNIQGIICPLFSFFWGVLGAVYYFFVHPYILGALDWLSKNLAFSFVIGLFFGVFVMDAAQSVQLVAKLKKYAEENEVIVKYESIKDQVRRHHDERKQRYNFFRPFKSDIPLREHIEKLKDTFEKRKLKKI